jgi:hypothetical protein
MQNTANPNEELIIIETAPVFDQGKLPVLRVDQKGKILFANAASLEFLRNILSESNEYIPAKFIETIPGMLNLNADFSVPVEGTAQTMLFDVIGFRECGYIGLYGVVPGMDISAAN